MLPNISLASLPTSSDSVIILGLERIILTMGSVSGKHVQVAPNSESDEVLPAGPDSWTQVC